MADDNDADTATTPPAEDPKFQFRRRVAAAVVFAAAIGLFGAPMLRSFTTIGTGADQTAAGVDNGGLAVLDQGDPTTGVTQADLFNAAADAQNHWLANTTIDGWIPPAGIGVARSERSVILAATLDDGQCTFIGLIDGYMNPVTVDATGTACQPTTLDAASEGLAVNDTAPAATHNLAANTARVLIEHSMVNLVASAPSFAGTAGTYDDGVSVSVSTDGLTAQITVSGNGCATVTVTAGNPDQAINPIAC